MSQCFSATESSAKINIDVARKVLNASPDGTVACRIWGAAGATSAFPLREAASPFAPHSVGTRRCPLPEVAEVIMGFPLSDKCERGPHLMGW